MKLSLLIEQATQKLATTSETPRLDAEVLLCHITGFNKAYLISHSDEIVDTNLVDQYHTAIERRVLHEPVAYITGKKEFYGYDFKVNNSVLIPRPETELIVDEVLKIINERNKPIDILDLGVGSGCIICSIILESNKHDIKCKGSAIDISVDALNIAETNARELGVYGQIDFYHGDWVKPLAKGQTFDVIVSNPPYIAEGDLNVSKGTFFEPQIALYADDNGLSDLSAILIGARSYLNFNGALFLEFGVGQFDAIEKLGMELGYNIKALNDLSGRPRIAVCHVGVR